MISSYRLGDLVLLNLGENEKNEILIDHPNSIGSKYILEKKKNSSNNNIDIITEIVLEYIKEISSNNIKINNVDYYQQLLDMNRYSLSQRKYLQGIINFAKKQNGLVTPKQFDILQRLKSGDFNYGKK